MENKFEILEKKYPNTLIMQLQGNFYRAYNNSAYVLSGLMNYKLTPTASGHRCGYPTTAFEKIVEECEINEINYVILSNDEVEAENKFEDNQYSSFLKMYSVRAEEIKKESTDKEKEMIIDSDTTRQKVVIIEGCGMNLNEAFNSFQANIERDLISNGFNINCVSAIHEKMGNTILVKGVVIYQ